MSASDNGGPAFPCEVPTGGVYYDNEKCTNAYATRPEPGMTLRDYFAAKAITGCLPGPNANSYDAYAEWAYRMADAMLKARKA